MKRFGSNTLHRSFTGVAGLVALTLLASCGIDLRNSEGQGLDGSGSSGSELQERRPGTSPGSWQNAEAVALALGAPQAVRINARTNMITYYENGTPQAKWKVATARPGYETPKGIFSIHHKDICPPWSRNGVSAGPCAPDNPLGKKALWFHQGFLYGMHGVDEAHIWSVTASNPRDRDQSSGCVRNHPENIEWLFARVSLGTPVVVGLWDADPQVVDCSGNAARCSGFPGHDNPPVLSPTWCSLSLADADGLANVRAAASTSSAIIDTLDAASKVRVIKKVTGESIAGSSDWYAVEYTLGGPKSGYLHSSLLDPNCLLR